MLTHSLEVGHLAGLMAAEVGANVKVAKLGGLLHDIGKALTHEIEGPHAEIGADIAKKEDKATTIKRRKKILAKDEKRRKKILAKNDELQDHNLVLNFLRTQYLILLHNSLVLSIELIDTLFPHLQVFQGLNKRSQD